MKSSYISEKPQPHYTWEQWQSGNRNMEKISERRQVVSNHVRQTGDHYRHATENTSKWKLKESNNRLDERIEDVDQWYRNLERILIDLKNQIQRLSEAKMAAEQTLRDLLLLQEAVKEVINYRDRRRGIDLVEDEPYRESKAELKLLDSVSDTIRNLCHDAWVQLLALKEQRDKLVFDLKDKEEALRIDKFQRSLTPFSKDVISLKVHPLEPADNTVDLETWLRNCNELRDKTNACITKAMQLTNDIWGILRTLLNEVDQQRDATERSLRRRIHETLNVRDKLGAQRAELQGEITKLEEEMMEIEKAIEDKMGNIKLAETRLESRKFRPGFERCADMANQAIKEEHKHVRQSQDVLKQHLRDVKNKLNGLQYQLHKVEEDLECKERSLAIDNACLESHNRPPKAAYQSKIGWRAPATTLEFANRIANGEDAAENFGEEMRQADRAEQITKELPRDVEEYLLVD